VIPTTDLPGLGAVSRIGFGTWGLFGPGVDLDRADRTFAAAIDAGIRHLDTAPNYGDGAAEEWLGRFLANRKSEVLIVATKAFFHPKADAERGYHGLSRRSILRSVEGSLARLKREPIDLLYCHRPDPDVPLEETLAVLGDLRRQGKIRCWAVSRWSAASIARATALAPQFGLPSPSATQEPWNRLLDAPARQLAAELHGSGVPVIGYSVMARGVLAGKHLHDAATGSNAAWPDDRAPWQTDSETRAQIHQLIDLAAMRGATTTSLLIADALQFGPCAAILTSASSPARIDDIVAGARLAAQPGFASEVAAIFHGPSD
jgi:aryl-alcohol dehydrogenase-like predicted oxidoreductase